jgi:hypothetical protein
MPDTRWRVVAFWLFTIVCVGAAIGYVRWRVVRPAVTSSTALLDPAEASVQSTIDRLRAAPHLTFLSTRSDVGGHIAITTLPVPADPAIFGGLECERSHFAADVGLCLELNRETMEPRAFASIVDRHFQTLARFPLAGLPIRARISHDRRYAAATVFVTGESYASDFTTRTTIVDLSARKPLADLEQFTVERDGKPFHQADFNFWGVTFFQDGNRFFATLGTAGQRLLVEGDIARRRMRVAGSDVECPSLSPDERHIVFKRQRARGAGWRLWARELASGDEWPITDDAQDVDDQVEWLDNDTVVYGRVFGTGVPENSLSLWTATIARASTLEQTLFLRSAYSPSVIR